MNIGIIGTAGRGDAGKKLSKGLYCQVYDLISTLLAPIPTASRALRSGGAAWLDHVAVSLFLEGHAATLDLFLPCAWDATQSCYVDNGSDDWRSNPGRISNLYHGRFGWNVAHDNTSTLEMIELARQRGAQLHEGRGLFDRNAQVARVDWLIAGTFGPTAVPADGGTKHTWDISKAKTKTHITLADPLVVHGPHQPISA